MINRRRLIIILFILCGGCTNDIYKNYQSALIKNISSTNTTSTIKSQPKIFIQSGHTDAITTLDSSIDGNIIITGSIDKTIKIWSLKNKKLLRTIRGHIKKISSVALSTNGNIIASSSSDGTIRIWDIKTGQQLQILKNINPVKKAILTPDDNQIISIDEGETIKIWDVRTGKLLNELGGLFSGGHTKVINNIAVSSDNKYIVSVGDDGKLILWDMKTKENLYIFKNIYGIDTISFSPDNTIIAFETYKTLNFLNIENKKTHKVDINKINGIKFEPFSDIKEIVYSPNGRSILVNTTHQKLLIDIKTESIIWKNPSRSTSLNIFSQDEKIIFQTEYNIIYEVHPKTGEMINYFADNITQHITHMTISPDGQYIVTAGQNGFMKLWDIRQMKGLPLMKGYSGTIIKANFSADNKYFVTLSKLNDETYIIQVRDRNSWNLLYNIKYDKNEEVMDFSLSPDGTSMAVIKHNYAGQYRSKPSHVTEIRKLNTGLLSKTLNNIIFSVIYTSDSKNLLSSCFFPGSNLCKVNINSGIKIKDYGSGSSAYSFKPLNSLNNNLLIAGYNGEEDEISSFQTFSSITGEVINEFSGHLGYISSVSFSADNRYIVSSGWTDNTVRLWDAVTAKQLEVFIGHTGGVGKAVITPNSKYIISSGSDESVKIWSIETRKLLVTIINTRSGGWIAITPEGYYDASPGTDKYLAVRIENNVYSIDQYRDQFYRPKIVQAALAGKTLSKLATLKDIKPAPNVRIINTATKVKTDEVTIKIQVTDQGGGVGNIRIYNGDTAVAQHNARDIMSHPFKNGGKLYSFPVPLTEGKNNIKVIAYNSDNTMSSTEAFYEIHANIIKFTPTLHALLIGIDEYENPNLNLKYAVADAVLMEKTLKAKANKIYKKRVRITRLTSPAETTKENILRTLKNYQSVVKPSDVFMFFVASHGTVDKDKYYLISSNVDSISSHILQKNAISQEELKYAIANIPSLKKIVLIDTCNSGKLGKQIQLALLTRNGLSEETALKLLGESVGSVLLSASTSKQQALEGYKKQGLFTYVVANGMNGAADKNKDKYIFTDELVGYVDLKVREISEKHFKQKQFPTTGLNGNMFPLTQAQ